MNKKMVIGVTTWSAVSLLVGSAMAQSSSAGLYGQISTGYESMSLTGIRGSSVEVPADGYNVNSTAPSQTFGSAPAVLGLGYYWQAHSSWLLGVGVDYSAISRTSPSWSSNVSNAPGNSLIPEGTTMTAHGSSVRLTNRYDVFISPGYVIDKDKLLYLKAGYSRVSAEERHATSVTVNINGRVNTVPTTTAGTSTNTTVGGYLIGVGYKQTFTGGYYGFVECNYLGYSRLGETYSSKGNSASKEAEGLTNTSVTNISGGQDLSTYQFLVGVGYSF
jgi:hypothetical protein